MGKIIVVCAFSAAGKDSIVKYISAKISKYKMIISTTSRPMRPNESEGNPYNFVTKEEFEKMIENNEFIEFRKYNTLVNNIPDVWYYGMHNKDIDLLNNSYIVVLDLLGLIEIKKYYKGNIISFFIDVDEETRRNRCVGRADFNLPEWERRYADDIKQFPENLIKKEVDFIVKNYNFHECINEIVRCLYE